MIRCGKCGTINKADETFCTECNAYLEWSGERIEDETAAPPPPPSPPPPPLAPPPPQARPLPPTPAPHPFTQPPYTPPMGAPSRGSSPAPVAQSRPAPSPMPPPAMPTQPAPAPPAAAPLPTAAAAAGAAAIPEPSAAPPTDPTASDAPPARKPAAADESPPARKPTATPDEPASRKPEKGSASPAPKAKPPATPRTETIKPGDLVCPACGSGNETTRKFCRRCGTSLLEAVVQPEPEPARVPWHRRLFGRGKPAEIYEAGERPAAMSKASGSRPRRRMSFVNLRTTVLGVMVIFGLGAYASYLYVPDVTTMTDDVIRMVRGRFTAPTPAVPISVRGAAAQGHNAGQAFDSDNSATYWLSPARSSADPRIEVSFQDAVDLRRIEIMSGAPGDDYSAFARPRRVALRVPGQSQEITLADTPEVQPFDIDLQVPEGQPLRFVVLDRFAGRDSDSVAIRNLVFGASG